MLDLQRLNKFKELRITNKIKGHIAHISPANSGWLSMFGSNMDTLLIK